jgi:hypothetical protein
MARYWRISTWLIAFAVAAAQPVAAEQQKPPAKAAEPQAKQEPAQAVPQGPALPDSFKLNLLIRSSIIALNQANQTGNYTVLQDLGAPAFRASNNSTRLAQIFAGLRQRKLDLSPVLFFTPKLVAQPQIAPNGLLRLMGYFPTAPERVNFNLIYQMVDGQWRLFGIGVNTTPAEVTAAVAQAGAGQQAPGDAPAQAAAPASANAAPRETQSAPPKAAQKPDGTERPSRKPQAANQSGSKKPAAADGGTATIVQNGAMNNAARIDLANPNPDGTSEPAQGAARPTPADSSPKKQPGLWESLNPFGTD